ncbi:MULTISPECIES: nitrite reductase small subunit NirD [Hydrocarboniphaga]|jgi:nitrite reductase (NADH) small subunit|uniref:Nitrite reductase, NAD(P)H-dependent,ferredoxinsubunit n=1 Tax=Hydrocarboniphaga effusa AP103 TaxID=1172194 RepID=I8T8Z1_9GAMM|nr:MULTISPECIES: nitrite reductase small subunit NirD [Hydrocarboniphaga]EIT70046.1 nitrite reductase, NAD(P)H-dependent,ferredoxinsubunit [Hydrocarboniphaga effusa AP103]EIT70233.1 nitrite reductase, NAD(P)H-dependent,ferredoxinsubunit [Hydrocarboniphaga effusa AP103]MDZ4079984.1 nitrite reductase small subunit NirD [Hydrocarboniphaga sp.]
MDGSAPDSTLSATTWHAICAPGDIVPNLGVAALVDDRQIAVFRVRQRDGSDQFYAIDNFDPQSDANVLSRGLTGSLGGRIVVASPIYKHHYDLVTGECLEEPATPVRAYAVRVEDGQVWVAV